MDSTRDEGDYSLDLHFRLQKADKISIFIEDFGG